LPAWHFSHWYLPLIVVQPENQTRRRVCEKSRPATIRAGRHKEADILNRPATTRLDADIAVLMFDAGRQGPRPLRGLAVVDSADFDAALSWARRVVVIGADADLAAVLTLLLRTGRLDVEVGYAPRRRTAATRAYRVPAGRRAARRARRGAAQRVPLIRDETGSAIVGAARWLPAGDAQLLHGEGVVDDAVLFDGDVAGVEVEPTVAQPGLRARVSGTGSRRWLAGRAAQLGSDGVVMVRDGVAAPRAARRSTVYRNTEGWLLVR
jgi:hypothetical protein